MSTAPVFKIIPTTQKYDWGKIGLASTVAQYASASEIPGFSLDETAPYAEVCSSLLLRHGWLNHVGELIIISYGWERIPPRHLVS